MEKKEKAPTLGELEMPILSDQSLTAAYRAITSLEVASVEDWQVVGYLALPGGGTLEQGTENLRSAPRS